MKFNGPAVVQEPSVSITIPQRKECRYFSCTRGEFAGPGPQYANKVTHSLEEYRRLFKKVKPGQLCGDISPDYLYYYQNAVPKILDLLSFYATP